MDRWDNVERKEKKSDLLLKMVAISGEIPANLPEKIVGSKSYATSLITDLKKKGYLLLRYRDGVRGYVLGKCDLFVGDKKSTHNRKNMIVN